MVVTNEIIITDKLDNEHLEQIHHENIKTFIYEDGNIYIDIEIEKLELSVRAYNCLLKEGLLYFSEIAFKDEKDLLNIPKMGIKSAHEILCAIKNVTLTPVVLKETDGTSYPYLLCSAIYNSLRKKLDLNVAEYYENVINYLTNYVQKSNLKFDLNNYMTDVELKKTLQSIPYIQEKYENFLIKLLHKNPYGYDEEFIYEQTPSLLKDKNFVFSNLLNLVQQSKITIDDSRYVVNCQSFVHGAISILKEREYDILIKRMQGNTLEKVSADLNISGERVRQIESKAIDKLNKSEALFKEDIYSDIYKQYSITADEFFIAFGSIQAYYYLALRYASKGKSANNKLPLIDALTDDNITDRLKIQIEKAVYKDCIKIGEEYIPCTRQNIIDYALRTYATDDISFSDFIKVYSAILDGFGKSNDTKLSLIKRGYEVNLGTNKSLLWKYGKKIRYYNFANYDFQELLSVLNLNQYTNVEYSTLKFFNMYPLLMKDYDIRDEYELHNLLKKICNKKDYPLIHFCRMPHIEFGQANRDSQVLELMLSLAPVPNDTFAAEYEKKYGVNARTVLANYMKNFEKYLHDGVYRIDAHMLPNITADRLNSVLTCDA